MGGGGGVMRGATVIMEHLLPTGRDTCGDVSIFIHRAIIDGLWPNPRNTHFAYAQPLWL